MLISIILHRSFNDICHNAAAAAPAAAPAALALSFAAAALSHSFIGRDDMFLVNCHC